VVSQFEIEYIKNSIYFVLVHGQEYRNEFILCTSSAKYIEFLYTFYLNL
jgi:hypothetical protein